MKKPNKVMTAVAAGAVGILALSACSSDASDQPQESRDAAAKHSNVASSLVLKSSGLNALYLEHVPEISCSEYGNVYEKRVTYQCNHLKPAYGDRAVQVRLLTDNYKVEVKTITTGMDPVTTVGLNCDHQPVTKSKTAHLATWYSNNIPNPNQCWSVAVGAGGTSSTSTIITVTPA